jgi:hypothetical protein
LTAKRVGAWLLRFRFQPADVCDAVRSLYRVYAPRQPAPRPVREWIPHPNRIPGPNVASMGFDYSISTATRAQLVATLFAAADRRANCSPPSGGTASARILPNGAGHIGYPDLCADRNIPTGIFKKLTLFARPSVAAIREVATPHPRDPFATAVAMQLAPSGKKIGLDRLLRFQRRRTVSSCRRIYRGARRPTWYGTACSAICCLDCPVLGRSRLQIRQEYCRHEIAGSAPMG